MALALQRLASLARLAGSCGVGGGAPVGRGRRLISLTSPRRGRLVAYKLADIGEGIREVTVKEWFVRPGDRVSQFDNICEVQSDKASVTITSRYDGVVKALHCDLEQTCLVGEALVDIELEADEAPAAAEAPTAPAAPGDRVLTTPAVRKIAKENAVDLSRVPATGRDGRVLKEDILAYLGKIPGPPSDAGRSGCEASDAGRSGSEARSGLGSPQGAPLADKKYARHMWKSMTRSLTIPHFVYSDELDVSKLVKLRGEVREAFESQGLSLSYMPFFLKAISRALLQHPELNAWIDEESESLDVRKEHNISLAMDTPGGLVVPNIKNVQDMSILDIAKELNRLQALGKKSSIPLNDLTAGTFSISNIGSVGGTYAKPVILSPQVVIGAVGKIQRLPRFDEHDNVIAANILTVSWAADHRVVDGVTMARFSNLWKYYIANPSLLLVGI